MASPSNACPRKSPPLRTLAVAAVLSSVACAYANAATPVAAAAASPVSREPAAPSRSTQELEARGLTLGAPVSRVFRSTGPDGRVVFSDRPEPGAKSVEVRSFAPSSDPQAVETARRRQAYWRAQAAAFSERQRERDEAERRARLEEERAAEAQSRYVLFVPHQLRAPWYAEPPLPPPPGAFPPVFPAGPGAAAGAPAAFIGSGFSTAR